MAALQLGGGLEPLERAVYDRLFEWRGARALETLVRGDRICDTGTVTAALLAFVGATVVAFVVGWAPNRAAGFAATLLAAVVVASRRRPATLSAP